MVRTWNQWGHFCFVLFCFLFIHLLLLLVRSRTAIAPFLLVSRLTKLMTQSKVGLDIRRHMNLIVVYFKSFVLFSSLFFLVNLKIRHQRLRDGG